MCQQIWIQVCQLKSLWTSSAKCQHRIKSTSWQKVPGLQRVKKAEGQVNENTKKKLHSVNPCTGSQNCHFRSNKTVHGEILPIVFEDVYRRCRVGTSWDSFWYCGRTHFVQRGLSTDGQIVAEQHVHENTWAAGHTTLKDMITVYSHIRGSKYKANESGDVAGLVTAEMLLRKAFFNKKLIRMNT